MNPNRQEKDTIALRLALAEQLYAIEQERLIFLKKYNTQRIVLLSLYALFLVIFLFYQIAIKKSTFLNYAVPIVLFGTIAGFGIYAFLGRIFVEYSKKIKPIVLKALCDISNERLNYGDLPDSTLQNGVEHSLQAWTQHKKAGRMISKLEFDDTFKGKKQGGWEIMFGDFHFKLGKDDSEEVHQTYHFLQIPTYKEINRNRFEAFKAGLPANFWLSYYPQLGILLVLIEQTDRQKQTLDFELNLKDSLRETKTLEKIQKAFYTNLNSFEDLIALFD